MDRTFPLQTTNEAEELRLDRSVLVFSHILLYHETGGMFYWDGSIQTEKRNWHLMWRPNEKKTFQMSRRRRICATFGINSAPSYVYSIEFQSAENKIRTHSYSDIIQETFWQSVWSTEFPVSASTSGWFIKGTVDRNKTDFLTILTLTFSFLGNHQLKKHITQVRGFPTAALFLTSLLLVPGRGRKPFPLLSKCR